MKLSCAGIQHGLGQAARLVILLAAGIAALAGDARAGEEQIVEAGKRFPFFKAAPVDYQHVKLQDTFWAPRQKTVHAVSVAWATGHYDAAGGLKAYIQNPDRYVPIIHEGDSEAMKFIEAMATVVGLQRDPAIEGMMQKWGQVFIRGQAADGYLAFFNPAAGADPAKRWVPVWNSHEDYFIGHYLEAGIATLEATGDRTIYDSALRAVDNMATVFPSETRAYAPGHEEISQALMRLYGMTGNTRYLKLCGWLIASRGKHEGRPDYSNYSQDHIPIKEQRSIEGHAVRGAFLYNGVTQYVGATGDADYRKAVLAVWDDFEQRKMYLHGAGGLFSTDNEGFGPKPYFIPPGDSYGESCSVVANFQWANNLFNLTGDARYLDTAERMLDNAFYASLALTGDHFFYCNRAQVDAPTTRSAWVRCPCCPPNIVKLMCNVGGFFYATDRDGIYVKQYGASEAEIPFGGGVKLIQRTEYPWDGRILLEVEPTSASTFALRLRRPAWARTHSLKVNGETVRAEAEKGWLSVRRDWKAGDRVKLELPMEIERVTMPPQFKEYAHLAALQRGPIVYCLEEQDVRAPLDRLAIPAGTKFTAERRPELLGGVTVLRGDLEHAQNRGKREQAAAMFVPYGVWDNRTAGKMRIWLGAGEQEPDTKPASKQKRDTAL